MNRTGWKECTAWERTRQIMEYTGAEEWSWIVDTFGGLTVAEIEDKIEENFNWKDSHALAWAIWLEVN